MKKFKNSKNQKKKISINKSQTNSQKRAEEFLKIASSFKLGKLLTENPHPATKRLDYWAKNDIDKALKILLEIEHVAIKKIEKHFSTLKQLQNDIANTIENGHRVFLCGCGATGRLALSLEFLWRKILKDNIHTGSVISFMAGGDVALIKSIEDFEDYPEYGKKMTEELGFKEGDLMIAITEGGETPYVIGALNASLHVSSRKHYFLYCNPDKTLKLIERSWRIISNPNIHKINLTMGPMSLTGSTRLQASTVQMLGVGLALFAFLKEVDFQSSFVEFLNFIKTTQLSNLQKFIIAEAEAYKNGHYLLYKTDSLGITILTDTTERSPTFNLLPFENKYDKPIKPSLSYLQLKGVYDSQQAWEKLLGRKPRTLLWPEFKGKADRKYLLGFDFSENAYKLRKNLFPETKQHLFEIYENSTDFTFKLDSHIATFPLPPKSPFSLLFNHIWLKIILNQLSTLIMGRLGRYYGNLMTYVVPNNKKLIDRAIRYTQILAKQQGLKTTSYKEIAFTLFEIMEKKASNRPVIQQTLEQLR